jgi:hypothetical protein
MIKIGKMPFQYAFLLFSLTPGMGYNTWNDFRCNGINAANIQAVADKMVELGLLEVRIIRLPQTIF